MSDNRNLRLTGQLASQLKFRKPMGGKNLVTCIKKQGCSQTLQNSGKNLWNALFQNPVCSPLTWVAVFWPSANSRNKSNAVKCIFNFSLAPLLCNTSGCLGKLGAETVPKRLSYIPPSLPENGNTPMRPSKGDVCETARREAEGVKNSRSTEFSGQISTNLW